MDGFIEIPFGAEDSESKGWEYTIPEGMEAVIKDGKIIVRQKESEDEMMRKSLIEYLKTKDHECDHWVAWLEKRGESNIDKLRKISTPAKENWFEIQKQWEQEDSADENERIRRELIQYLRDYPNLPNGKYTRLDFFDYLEKQKKPNLGKYIEEDNIVYRLNWVMQDFYKAGRDEEEQEHRLKCYKLFWDALEDSTFFEQKEQNIYKSSKSEIDFADRYSKDVWEKLMSKFKMVERYSIGCNDVSDIVLNAILNAFKWQKERQSMKRAIMQDFNYHEGEPDEKAWNRLFAILNYAGATSGDTPGEEIQALINWIEGKQKKRKPVERSVEDNHIIGFVYDLLNEIKWKDDWAMSKEECLRQLNDYRPQKPVEWSEEDEEMINALIRNQEILLDSASNQKLRDTYSKEIEWLKSRCPQTNWKFSEEELLALKRGGAVLRDDGLSELSKQIFMIEGKLANLSVVSKPIWKPSEEQMEILDKIYHYLWTDKNATAEMQDGLGDLIEELKKL